MAFPPGGLGSLFPGMRFAIPGAPGYGPTPQSPDDGRTPYTGAFATGQADSAQAGNNSSAAGPQLGGSGVGPGGAHYGPVPMGGWSQLGGRANGTPSGYQPTPNPGYVPPNYSMYADDVNGRALSGPNGPLPPEAPTQGQPGGTPHAHEPNLPNAQPMMGQWGGGGWNVGGGAPASAQPMWLGSMNGGQSWAQAPGYNTRAPQAGQTTPMWGQAPNQDADSPTWVQR